MKSYEIVLFDFDGVLCHDRFYALLQVHHPKVYEFVETRVFGQPSDIPDRWMRGQLTSDDVNRLISENTGIDFDVLSALFIEGVARMRVDVRLMNLARTLASNGISVGLVTGNMDVFNQVIIKRHALSDVFPVIVNSCDYGCLKHEGGGRLFDVALALLGREGDFDKSLLIDDSAKAREAFTRKGGDVFPYTEYGVFRRWIDANLSVVAPRSRRGRHN